MLEQIISQRFSIAISVMYAKNEYFCVDLNYMQFAFDKYIVCGTMPIWCWDNTFLHFYLNEPTKKKHCLPLNLVAVFHTETFLCQYLCRLSHCAIHIYMATFFLCVFCCLCISDAWWNGTPNIITFSERFMLSFI